jgi:thiol:disulfide interchange protein
MTPMPIKRSRNTLRLTRSSTLALAGLALATTCLLSGCKENKPVATETASVSQQPVQPSATVPFVKKHLYSETADPKADIAAALKQARAENKRVILDFGGDWCGDCQVLDIYMHQDPNAELLARHFIVVHVDIGHMDHNVDVAQKYNVPIQKGVPALAVLDSHGKLLFSQENKEFENMRNMKSEDVTAFLNKWKA